MKLLSITVPCYNSQDYMEHCIQSLLPGGELVEILIVDDGSSDRTAEIADEYAAKYPTIIRAIHQPNKGHGGAVNTGIAHATGMYFKVVDSDDWVGEDAYLAVLKKLQSFCDAGSAIDMMLSNFIYDKDGAKHKKTMHYRNILPVDEIFEWRDAKIRFSNYYLMHSVIYRTEMLRECGLQLPEHTFYVDNLYVYYPLPYVKKMYYMDVDFYHYYIGREDQSVNESIMIQRIDQQILVNRLIIESYDPFEIEEPKLRKYMLHFVDLICMVTTVMLIKGGEPEHLEKKRALWNYIKTDYPKLYRYLTHHYMGFIFNLPKKMGNTQTVVLYSIARKVFGFN